MDKAKTLISARKIHRAFVVLTVIISAVMIFTGLLLKYPLPIFSSAIDDRLVREVHSFFSTFFSLVLLVMIITGTYMYVFPY